MNSVAAFLTGSVSSAHLLYTDQPFSCQILTVFQQIIDYYYNHYYRYYCTIIIGTIVPNKKWLLLFGCCGFIGAFLCILPFWKPPWSSKYLRFKGKRLEMIVFFYYTILTDLQSVAVTLQNSQIQVFPSQSNHLALPSITIEHLCCTCAQAHRRTQIIFEMSFFLPLKVDNCMYAPPPVLKSTLPRQNKWARVCTQQNTLPLINHEKVNYTSLGEWLGSVVITPVFDT